MSTSPRRAAAEEQDGATRAAQTQSHQTERPQYLVIHGDRIVGRHRSFREAVAFSLGYERARAMAHSEDEPGCTLVARVLGG